MTGGVTTVDEKTAGDCEGVAADEDEEEGIFIGVESKDQSASTGGLLKDFDPKLVIIIAVGVAVVFLVILAFCYCKQYRQVKQEAAQAYTIPAPENYMMAPQTALNNSYPSFELSMNQSPGSQSTRV
jgi:hypothetical protein